jgi:hypothetical protein
MAGASEKIIVKNMGMCSNVGIVRFLRPGIHSVFIEEICMYTVIHWLEAWGEMFSATKTAEKN